ncbi:amidohydrolase family protein [Flavobacterium weaverense]|uniref:L-fuconolactonase n=1 Tax=Flavobacterium weaverense TaxID=271156 RepID=A0A3L9ZGS7_9FLAO|nr:amidohydrolase family protein [Flavobacterium weaverense]RMA71644.1 L-fuconolactonase [Flavobacterium weaverense]
MRIDSHQHFWHFDPVRDSWINEDMSVLQRDFLPKDLEPLLKENNFEGCIAVQADSSEKETEFLLNLAERNSFIKGVVGWLDLCSDTIEARLEYFSKFEKLKGLRHIVQSEQKGFMLRADFQRGISALEKYKLTYDILIYPNQLEEAILLVEKFSNQQFILDHCAKPYIKDGKIKVWKSLIEELSAIDNVACKVSGLTTEADWTSWQKQQFEPYFEAIFDCFGTERTIFGSDWPVSLLAGNYSTTLSLVENYIQKFTKSEQQQIMGLNAKNLYDIKD